ncbi:MAG: hypothetical protein RBT19_03865 [Tenuifilaceae bacterium]|jgi:hypothetical protein|nr:hypothetical protein [Tenuifilaceae bacterium]
MKLPKQVHVVLGSLLIFTALGFYTCGSMAKMEEDLIEGLRQKGLVAEVISAENFYKGVAPGMFHEVSGAPYKPSYNEEPEIPAQCWIETGYGTQNACKYCHTDYLAEVKHGNNFPISDDQETYSFPSANLNRILWQNIIYPHKIEERLLAEGIDIPSADDVAYVRVDNWQSAFNAARGNGSNSWLNIHSQNPNFVLFPALNPNHLFPCNPQNPTNYGANGYIDSQGFVKDEGDRHTGWRAVNFFPYAIFTPLTGSVSGIYIRLSEEFMTNGGVFDVEVYKQNLELLEKNIKNQKLDTKNYVGDASKVKISKGFYPVGTEFAHPLHYVDLLADGEVGKEVDGVLGDGAKVQFEFPGTRSKRVKEIRYMYKWREVGLDDIGEDEEEEDEGDGFGQYIGKEGQGWIDNEAGWILAAFIENRQGELRPQTTEELAQCLGCHSKVGNTIDAVWSFQRKLPALEGWADMNYGKYSSSKPNETKLQDYLYQETGMGEQGYFYHSVVGADLYGVMPAEIRLELVEYAQTVDLQKELGISYDVNEILNDEALKLMERSKRKPLLLARQKLMRHYSKSMEYLAYSQADDNYYIKGNIFYPLEETMKANIQGYRKIVLDQSYNLGKDVFGSEADHIPFTFRSDGTVLDENNQLIPVGEVIYSRPYNADGEGITPTGIVEGDVYNADGQLVKDVSEEDRIAGRLLYGGTLDKYYNPILSGVSVRRR